MFEDEIEVKRMFSADQRREMADAGEALPDGSFPIADEEDLQNAIQAFGRAKDKAAAKKHIMRRAAELDAEDMIPEEWMAKGMGGYEMDDEEYVKGGAAMYDDEDMMDEEDLPMEDDEEMEGKAVVKIDGDGMVSRCAKGLSGDACGYEPGAKVCGKCGAMAVQTKGYDYEDGEYGYAYDAEDEDFEVARLDVADIHESQGLRRLHLEDMGMKSAEIYGGAYRCMIERKVFDGGTAPCASCTGGCSSPDGLPDLAEMEAVAGTLFGKVLDSGYSDAADRFLVAVERKDGLFEAHFDGTGQFQALVRIPEESLLEDPVVTADEAITSALTEVQGKALSIDAANLEGHEVYSVEVEGTDGKSYDVFVDPLNGKVLAYDAYELSADEVDGDEVSEKALPDSEFVAAMMEFELLEAESATPAVEPEATTE